MDEPKRFPELLTPARAVLAVLILVLVIVNLTCVFIDKTPLRADSLDLFMGGRILTGYHFWAFCFMALVFHLHFFMRGDFSWRLECRTIGCIMSFWIIEDFTWFVCNPAYGWTRLTAEHVPWHKVWILGVPVDYIVLLGVGLALIIASFRGEGRDVRRTPPAPDSAQD